MSTVAITCSARKAAPPMPEGELELQEPPALPELQPTDMSSMLTYLPMGLGSGAMVFMFAGGSSGPMTYLAAGLMAASSVGMMLGQVGRQGRERKRRLNGERRDYLRYLSRVRRQVRAAMAQQRAAVAWNQPDPAELPALVSAGRLWERRPSHEDFAEVRLGLGTQRSALRLVPPQTKPVEDLEPLCASALRRFIRAHTVVTDIPTALHLTGMSYVRLVGDADRLRALLRSMVLQLATFQAPEELRIAALVAADAAAHWQWLKWLPHAAHPVLEDAAGPVRLFAETHEELFGLLGPGISERPGFEPSALPSSAEPFLVVLSDGVETPSGSVFAEAGIRNAVLLELHGARDGGRSTPPATIGAHQLHLTVDGESLAVDRMGASVKLSTCGQLSARAAERLARQIAPFRTSGVTETAEPLTTDFDLTRLLGIRDPRTLDVRAIRRSKLKSGGLRVPIGLSEDGSVVELDLKESAQGGMGPHGMLIGATGSGKSELLRTLVVALAVTHSSETLNFVLVDFKGGATFLGMDGLPHTSAFITNLADELALVDRMQDSLHGELIRRQELLRKARCSSLLEYNRARDKSASLDPLPTLFVVVDEFSELLATKPEFIDLFVMIGRLGRSLGVHLLLASQRLDEGRIHQLESHLSYRIALRTFSSMESRSVIGVANAYELPPAPGNGFLKFDTTNLVRFKAGYVSGPCRTAPLTQAGAAARGRELVPFDLRYQVPSTPAALDLAIAGVPPAAPAAEPAPPQEEQESLLAVLVHGLRGQGPPARQVWLPPLHEAPTLDQLLPGIVPSPERGLAAVDWPGCGLLAVPVGIVDRPAEQRRELLVADLAGVGGHVGIVGAPRIGKSTLVRTMLLALALTHTPAEVQFYCFDFGGGGLKSLTDLPHVGSVAARGDRDRVLRTIAELTALLQRREQQFADQGVDSMGAYRKLRAGSDGEADDPYGDVFLVIDGWFTLRQEFEDVESAISELATRGLGYGIHLVVTSARWSEIRPWLRDLLGTRFELRLGDPLESEIGSRQAASVPTSPGRGILPSGHHFLTAVPRVDGRRVDGRGVDGRASTDDLPQATRSLIEDVADHWSGPGAPPVRMLPAQLPSTELPEPDGDLRVHLGLDEVALEPVAHDFEQSPGLMVFGDAKTGKTNLLRLIARAVVQRYSPAEARILLGDARRELVADVPEAYRIGYAVTSDALRELATSAETSIRKRLPGPEISPEELRRRDWWYGPRLFVLVDDYDLLSAGIGGPLDALVPLLAHGAEIGLHVVVSRSSSGAMRAMMDPVMRRMWELGMPGLLLSYPKEEGKFLGEAAPRQLPPGRAQLVTRRGVVLVQTAFATTQASNGEV